MGAPAPPATPPQAESSILVATKKAVNLKIVCFICFSFGKKALRVNKKTK
jgi:hypothetical protein